MFVSDNCSSVLLLVVVAAACLCGSTSTSSIALSLTQQSNKMTNSYRSSSSDEEYDVIVFGATPAGFAASLGAKAAGAKKVLLLEPTSHVGGMASAGGIGLRDCSKEEIITNSGSQYQWALRNGAYYGEAKTPVWQPDNWVGERTFLQMLNESGVELRLNTTFVEGPDGITTALDKTGLRHITAIKLESGVILSPKYVIDASYEGELMIGTGHVTYTFGRESNTTYNESLGGVTRSSIGQFDFPINPYYTDGKANTTLLKWIQDGPDPRTRLGKMDRNVMAYSFRACLTKNTSNMVPFKQPEGYDSMDFELQRRYMLAELAGGKDPHRPWGNSNYKSYPSHKDMKYDACCGTSPVGIDAAGLAVGYSNGSRSQRKEIYNKHRYYVQGLMWFWANDEAVPKNIRDEMNAYGLCKDEWPDNDHFPPQMYVREAARIVGDKVFSQNDRLPYTDMKPCYRDSIAIGSWGFDIHEMERVAVKDCKSGKPIVYNEGLTKPNDGGVVLFDIPYYVLLPKRNEIVNLAVPNCPSVSHVAFSAIREEPTLWQLGEAAGVAAAVAMTSGENFPLQDVDHKKLQSAIIDQGTFVRWPPHQNCTESNKKY